MDMIYWDHYYNAILALNFLVVIGLFTSLRLFSGVIAHIHASDELLCKDNPAFGISLASTTLAVTIVLSGLVYGRPDNTIFHTVAAVAVFGVLGIGLMALTRIIFDRVTLRDVSLRDEIVGGNVAVAIADAANILAAAIIIRALMVWTTPDSVDGAIALLGGYAVSQVILTVVTWISIKIFRPGSNGTGLQDYLKQDNRALALRFAGKKIGTAFAIAMAAQIVVYEVYDIAPLLAAWFVVSIIAVAVWRILCLIAEKIILFRVDVQSEVLDQRNIAIGALQAAIYISLGILMSSL